MQQLQATDLSSILLKNSTYAGTWEDPTSGMKYVTGGGIKIKFKSATNNYTPWVKAQYALNNKNLDGSEDFTLGGMEGVKVFSDGEQSVENAIMFNTEFQIRLPEIQTLTNKLGLFYDVASGDMSDSSKDSQFKRRTLQDAGIGYYTNYKNAFTKLQIARVVGSEDIESENVGDNSRVLFQAGLTF